MSDETDDMRELDDMALDTPKAEIARLHRERILDRAELSRLRRIVNAMEEAEQYIADQIEYGDVPNYKEGVRRFRSALALARGHKEKS